MADLFRVTCSISGGHEPGDLRTAAELPAGEVDRLVAIGAVVPLGVHLKAESADPTAERDGLLEQIADLHEQLVAEREERAALTARIAEFEAAAAARAKRRKPAPVDPPAEPVELPAPVEIADNE